MFSFCICKTTSPILSNKAGNGQGISSDDNFDENYKSAKSIPVTAFAI